MACCCSVFCSAAPGLRQSYTDDVTGTTHTLNTQRLAFDDAEGICNDLGGHVVSYGSISEQVAVELFYNNKASGAGAAATCSADLTMTHCATAAQLHAVWPAVHGRTPTSLHRC